MQHDFILLDRTGSMGERPGQWTEALNAINGYVKKLAEDKVDTGVTIVAFDKDGDKFCFDVLRDRITPSTMFPLTTADASPRGLTPLNQATHMIVERAVAGNYEKVVLIIMTDGYENCSAPQFTHESVRKMLDGCRAKGWQVIFLGANFDNASQATSYGTAHGQHIHATVANFAGTMRMTAAKRSAFGATGQAMTYTDDEKLKASS